MTKLALFQYQIGKTKHYTPAFSFLAHNVHFPSDVRCSRFPNKMDTEYRHDHTVNFISERVCVRMKWTLIHFFMKLISKITTHSFSQWSKLSIRDRNKQSDKLYMEWLLFFGQNWLSKGHATRTLLQLLHNALQNTGEAQRDKWESHFKLPRGLPSQEILTSW